MGNSTCCSCAGRDSNNYNPDGQARELSLVALSPLSDKPLWEVPLPGVAEPPKANARAEPQFDWPLVIDLDGKGMPAVVVPFFDYASGASGLEVLEGASGKSRWRQSLSCAVKNWRHPQPDRIVVGPDLDGDGFHELFAASRDEQTYRVYVDAPLRPRWPQIVDLHAERRFNHAIWRQSATASLVANRRRRLADVGRHRSLRPIHSRE